MGHMWINKHAIKTTHQKTFHKVVAIFETYETFL